MRSLTPVFVCAVGLTCATFACGGDAAPESTVSTPAAQPQRGGGSIDACTLVTNAEADQALGAPSKQERPAEANHPPHLMACRYTAERGQGLAVLTILVRTGYSETEAKGTFEGTRDLGKTEPVSGLGDQAFWFADQLNVLKGLRSLTLTGDVRRSSAEELARKAADRLP